MKLCNGRVQVVMQDFFFQLGLFIATFPKSIIFSILFITFVSSFGLRNYYESNDPREVFVASDAPSRAEGRVVNNFLAKNGTMRNIKIMIQAKNRTNLLDDGIRTELRACIHHILKVQTVRDKNDASLTYENLCEPYCMKPAPLVIFLNIFEQNLEDVERHLTYPTAVLYGRKIFIGQHIFEASLFPNSSYIQGFKTAMLQLFIVHPDKSVLIDWEKTIEREVVESNRFPDLNVIMIAESLIGEEIKKMGDVAGVVGSVALPSLTVFVLLCSLRSNSRESKPLECLLGCVVPGLSSLTTVGIVCAAGFGFQSIVVSVFFLILAIGFDDIFIMLSAWHATRKEENVKLRVAETVKHSGVAMLVTTFTNVISFGVGCASTTSALQVFSIYAVIANSSVFLYQLLLFPAFLACTAHTELQETRFCLPKRLHWVARLDRVKTNIFSKTADIVTRPSTVLSTFVLFLSYWIFALYGLSTIRTTASIKDIAPPDSRVAKSVTEYDRLSSSYQPIAIVFQTPGDLHNFARQRLVHEAMRAFERTDSAFGSQSTFCWLRDYVDYTSSSFSGFTYEELPAWLEENPLWKPTLQLNVASCAVDSAKCVSAFICTTGFVNRTSDIEVRGMLSEYRMIASQYKELGLVVFTERSDFSDQTNSMSEALWQTVLAEIVFMGAAFLLFIPDTTSIAAATFSVLSINLGVFGFLSLSGVGIDPLSLAALLMAIGFSVDISAHISYHYYESHATTTLERVEESFQSIGWPTTQGALSTFIAILPITLKETYLSKVFFRTVALVTSLGIVHGLFVLPVCLAFITRLTSSKKQRRHIYPEAPPLQIKKPIEEVIVNGVAVRPTRIHNNFV